MSPNGGAGWARATRFPSARSTCAQAAGGGGSTAHRKASWSCSMACIARSQRPDRLVYTEIFEKFPDTESVVTTVLADEKGKTRLTVTAPLSIDRSSNHRHRVGHGERRGNQLRPAGGSGDQTEGEGLTGATGATGAIGAVRCDGCGATGAVRTCGAQVHRTEPSHLSQRRGACPY